MNERKHLWISIFCVYRMRMERTKKKYLLSPNTFMKLIKIRQFSIFCLHILSSFCSFFFPSSSFFLLLKAWKYLRRNFHILIFGAASNLFDIFFGKHNPISDGFIVCRYRALFFQYTNCHFMIFFFCLNNFTYFSFFAMIQNILQTPKSLSNKEKILH